MIKRFILLALAVALTAAGAVAQENDERAAYHQARTAATVEAWESYLLQYPAGCYTEQARKLRDAAIVSDYCNEKTSLERLSAYLDTVRAYEPRIRLFYANLVNNPTSSYRIEHLDLGFNGTAGRVDERVTLADGTVRNNVFLFNAQGLLVQSVIQGAKGTATVDYAYAYDNLHGHTLKSSQRKGGKAINYASIYDAGDRRVTLKGDNGTRQEFTYNDNGQLTKRVVTQEGQPRHTWLYKDGYIIREEVGDRVFRYHYDLDTATGKKFLISIEEVKGSDVVHKRAFDYAIDTHGRYTRVAITLDDKPQMTIERSYKD